MYPYLQYTKVYAKVQARSRLQLELFGTDPFEGTRDIQRDVLEFSSPPVTRTSIFLVAKGEIEGHFQTVSSIFASQIPR